MVHAEGGMERSERPPVLVVQGLTKTFRDFWLRTRARAVDGVSFHVGRGEIFGLLGPNGSGKSTTIKIVLGLLRQTAGRVAVFGKPPTDVSIKRRIGYLPEESYLYPFLNARETLDYYGKLFQLDLRTRQRRIDELLEMVGLGAVQHRAVREYSKGMQRRLGIAQALINDPELLILDEPTTGLDPIGTRQIKDLILELGRRGKSVVLSSHLLADVEDCVDRMVILYGGKIQREGTCDQLLETGEGSVIQADALDEGTVAEIDEVIRRRTGGEKSIRRVSRPRQRLEDLFVQIVEEARAKRVETSGAQHGGATAEFLRAQPVEGGALIESLVAGAEEPGETARAAAEVASDAARVAAADEAKATEAVISQLTAAPSEPAPRASPAAPPASGATSAGTGSKPAPAAKPAEADRSVIDALLGGDGGSGGTGGTR
jgi:ABC-2 type transport system ATP-binding protein